MKEYASAVRQYRWVLDSVELFLSTEPDGAILDVSKLARGASLSVGRPLSDQQILHALSALSSLGVLHDRSTQFSLDKPMFDASAERRSTVRAILDALPEISNMRPDAELCVSLPPTIAAAAKIVIREMTTDYVLGYGTLSLAHERA